MDTDCGDSESGINKCREGLERETALGEKENTLHYMFSNPKIYLDNKISECHCIR